MVLPPGLEFPSGCLVSKVPVSLLLMEGVAPLTCRPQLTPRGQEFEDLVYIVMALISMYQEALSASRKLSA